MHAIYILFVIDATVSFSSPSFTAVEESEVATICVTLEDDIERNLTVTLSSTEQCKIHYLSLFHLNYPHHYFCLVTADEFSDFSTSLTFTAGERGRELCHNVSVTDDDILEDTEIFTITLSSTDEDILIQSSTALLAILDETDGKLTIKTLPTSLSCILFCKIRI